MTQEIIYNTGIDGLAHATALQIEFVKAFIKDQERIGNLNARGEALSIVFRATDEQLEMYLKKNNLTRN